MAFIVGFGELGSGDVERAGGKAANLGELTRAGLPVPPGFVITTQAYRDFVEQLGLAPMIIEQAASAADPVRAEAAAAIIQGRFEGELAADLQAEISAAYAGLGDDVRVAVRSSATAEDLAEASFAGQQDTFLNIRGLDELVAAIRRCWASLWNARAIIYRARQGVDPATVSLAVVVQTMVEADAAGVMFTANPANGRRDELMISAAFGLGEAVVSGLVDTDDLVLDKADDVVRERRTAAKMIMTRYADHGTEEVAVPDDRQGADVLNDAAAAELARLGRRVEDHYGSPQDIEWARSGGHFFVLQARAITALPEVTGPIPTEWDVAEPKSMYVRASIVEQLPDPLTPLFADLIDGSVTRSLMRLMAELVGEGVVRYRDVGLPVVNGYAYYRYTPRGLARLTLRTYKAIPVIYADGRRSGIKRWELVSHPRYVETVDAWSGRSLDTLDNRGLLDGVIELLDAGTEYYTSVQTIIPIAAMAELIFTGFYDRAVRRAGDPPASTFLLGFDSEPIRAEQSLYDLATWTRQHPTLTAQILEQSNDAVLEGREASDDWSEWRHRFDDHLRQYGHAIYNLDFANAVPADAPGPLLETLRFYLRGLGADPRVRRQGLSERREEATRAVLDRLDRVRGRVFRRLLTRAQRVAPSREDALADVGLAWPELRRLLFELGRRLAAAGVITEPADVFWLRLDEVTEAAGSRATSVAARREIWRGQRRATPPQLLPKKAWFTFMRRMLPAASEEQTGAVIKGTAASAGVVTAPARVLGGPEEFHQMQPGEVLVASITTPAWTSLFAMASAVVTDIGGPLSHSSIVAREYGIPAVLGTAVATRRLHSGELIRVDGDAGTVTVVSDEQ